MLHPEGHSGSNGLRNWMRNEGSVLETSPLLAALMIAMFVLVIAHMVLDVPVLGAQSVIVDFDAVLHRRTNGVAGRSG